MIAGGVGLIQDQGCGGIVDRKEYDICAGVLGFTELDGIVLGVLGAGGYGDDFDAQLFGLGFKGLVNAGGVGAGVVIDHSDLGAGNVLGHVAGGSGALVGVVIADLIDVVFALGDLNGRGRRRQHKDTILIGLGGNGNGWRRGGRADKHLHAPVEQIVVSIDGLFCIAFVVLTVDFDLDAALGVDFLGGQLGTVLGGVAVLCGVTGQRADGTDLQRTGGAVGFLSAAGEKTCYKCYYKNYTQYFFHFHFRFLLYRWKYIQKPADVSGTRPVTYTPLRRFCQRAFQTSRACQKQGQQQYNNHANDTAQNKKNDGCRNGTHHYKQDERSAARSVCAGRRGSTVHILLLCRHTIHLCVLRS